MEEYEEENKEVKADEIIIDESEERFPEQEPAETYTITKSEIVYDQDIQDIEISSSD